MPWWIWLLLVVGMIAVLVAGLAYVAIRALALARTASKLGAAVSRRFSDLDAGRSDDDATPPIFTQPLRSASEAYVSAHSHVVARDMAARRRHVERWERWLRFNS